MFSWSVSLRQFWKLIIIRYADQRDCLFILSSLKFDYAEPFHRYPLQNIYHVLMNSTPKRNDFADASAAPQHLVDIEGISDLLSDGSGTSPGNNNSSNNNNSSHVNDARAPQLTAVGIHWQEIGFQGTDPRTDLNRGGGFFNVVCMLYLANLSPVLLREMREVSLNPIHEFPFCVTVFCFFNFLFFSQILKFKSMV